jgi:hypothetical protein
MPVSYVDECSSYCQCLASVCSKLYWSYAACICRLSQAIQTGKSLQNLKKKDICWTQIFRLNGMLTIEHTKNKALPV